MNAAARQVIIAGNWKMQKLRGETEQFMRALESLPASHNGCDVVIAPPFTSLDVAVRTAPAGVAVYAQNAHDEPSGAYTGEVSAQMLRDAGATGVILGHSERRQYFAETDGMLARKLAQAVDNGLRAILCVGETLEQRDSDNAEGTVEAQLRGALEGFDAAHADDIAIAYEPVWAIGTGRTATPELAQAMHAHIRDVLRSLLGDDVAGRVPVLYGGSVKPDNVESLLSEPDIDGALVGGASLEPGSFVSLVQAGVSRAAARAGATTASTAG